MYFFELSKLKKKVSDLVSIKYAYKRDTGCETFYFIVFLICDLRKNILKVCIFLHNWCQT